MMSDQEESICIGDVLLDGVYVVELPQHSPACSPGVKPKLLSHQMSVEPACQSSACVTMSSDISTAAVSNATATLTTYVCTVRVCLCVYMYSTRQYNLSELARRVQ